MAAPAISALDRTGLAAPTAHHHKSSANDPTRKAAEDFEAVMLSQIMEEMFAGVEPDENFGGGTGEKMFRSLLNEKVAGSISKQGGIGIADAVQGELIKLQEGMRK
jgi:flagellar protein FlgJ